ncbi:MAG: FAD-dependent oxidoreductase, partial [Bdellovibrionales bacterium]|nr:FAD-dependent oxidoreductase [Bdellovibrionales bacterium]
MSKKLQFILDFDENIDLFLKNECPNYIDYRVIRKSLDARGANRGKKPRYQYQVEVIFSGENFSVYDEKFINISNKNLEPIIIGAGPAGLFCALRLLEYGIKATIIERGTTSSERMVKIAKYWKKGIIDPESNVSFGEGGAGLFSDGKLVTRIKSPYVSYIMKKLVDFGAPKETAYLSNPHLGSNKIRKLITLITQYLKEQGCIIHFNTKMKRIILKNDEVEGIEVEDGTIYYSNKVILATGHSAR